MRSTPAAHPGTDRPPFECRIRFPGRLSDAVLVSPDAPLPPARSRPETASSPRPTPAPQSAPTPPADPADFWKTDVARELKADRERIEAVLAKLQAAGAGLREDQADRIREWQRAAVELAVAVATRVLHDRVEGGDFPIEAKVRDMIDELGGDAPATVHLNPADLALLESRLGGEPLLPGRDDPRLVPDPALGRADCRVEVREAMLVSDVTRELQELRDDLLRRLGNARP
ncbi:MAG: flagellar assembly protein [Gemmataceae bacterium]|nr:flagellar assembly protein [Gemmataceae bacterium]